MSKIKLGIIGIGNMGSAHAGNIKNGKCPNIEITAIADTNAQRLEWAKQQEYDENITYFDDAIKMLDSGLIDSCLVAVPHYEHTKYAIASMERGIHVMVEKPAGVYTKQVVEMNKVAEQHMKELMNCLYQMRHIFQNGWEIKKLFYHLIMMALISYYQRRWKIQNLTIIQKYIFQKIIMNDGELIGELNWFVKNIYYFVFSFSLITFIILMIFSKFFT